MKQNSELRQEARDLMSGQWGNFVVVILLYYIISSAASATFVGAILLTMPMGLSLLTMFLNLEDKNADRISGLFDFTKNYSKKLGLSLLVALYTALWSLLFVIPGIIKSYSYAMSFYISAENPELSVEECISESVKMMYGYKMKLFLLDLSFIGWAILCCFTFGIGFLFLCPYMYAARARFYEDIKTRN